ncbi:SMI1/KNR4 family protein [Halalkalibacterium halodurans]|uniref:SMI1/KNR4 family protein n=1 Tax=Halalkalibacterium halodurans TaxID=86665 RepID=UPI002AA9F2E8|nr:SMI1/KNR4 family protein [Halalkalibacterium halodurans]MDY7224713.1 SMI1/KNR4 family protein [Halalkalibacterium halodurans]MDY7243934.1 SMI1/KNR4 family protein [Halalkalibacterium halodurans]
MTTIKNLIKQIKNLDHCHVYEPIGLPQINEDQHVLPNDLKEFYTLCGGVALYENKDYPIYVVPPEEFILANPVIVGELCEEDISSDWYIICSDGKGEHLTIDLHKSRLGKCYDSFFDRHGIVGETQVIATSFTDLLERLIDNQGQHWYWLQDTFEDLGDAYDGIDVE